MDRRKGERRGIDRRDKVFNRTVPLYRYMSGRVCKSIGSLRPKMSLEDEVIQARISNRLMIEAIEKGDARKAAALAAEYVLRMSNIGLKSLV